MSENIQDDTWVLGNSSLGFLWHEDIFDLFIIRFINSCLVGPPPPPMVLQKFVQVDASAANDSFLSKR